MFAHLQLLGQRDSSRRHYLALSEPLWSRQLVRGMDEVGHFCKQREALEGGDLGHADDHRGADQWEEAIQLEQRRLEEEDVPLEHFGVTHAGSRRDVVTVHRPLHASLQGHPRR